jgi:hypothetical protein
LAVTSINRRKVAVYLPPAADLDIGHEKKIMKRTSYIAPVRRKNEKISSFVKTGSYKIALVQRTLLP